ncbi:MAG: hypothetical protein IJ594_10910 [Oscillospiraceae bacterium]|nr:hypothetical protein [Oscillospiraceae bacterium]
MANYVYRNQAGAGEYTQSERTWLTILRPGSLIVITGGLLCAIFSSAPPVVWILLLAIGFTGAAVAVQIIRRGYARYKLHAAQNKNGKKKKKR